MKKHILTRLAERRSDGTTVVMEKTKTPLPVKSTEGPRNGSVSILSRSYSGRIPGKQGGTSEGRLVTSENWFFLFWDASVIHEMDASVIT